MEDICVSYMLKEWQTKVDPELLIKRYHIQQENGQG